MTKTGIAGLVREAQTRDPLERVTVVVPGRAVEEYLNGTDPAVFVDYTKPENNRDGLHSPTRKPETGR